MIPVGSFGNSPLQNTTRKAPKTHGPAIAWLDQVWRNAIVYFESGTLFTCWQGATFTTTIRYATNGFTVGYLYPF